MTETLRKKIATVLAWVLIITPVHIAMGSVVFSSIDEQINQSVASPEAPSQLMHATVAHKHNIDHDDTTLSKSDSHCQQETGCSGCDSCSHCLNVICTVILADLLFSDYLNIPTKFALYQTERSAAFRPPKHT